MIPAEQSPKFIQIAAVMHPDGITGLHGLDEIGNVWEYDGNAWRILNMTRNHE